ncbi:MAG: ATP-binding protein [Eubacteriales bacterium]|nr:ATP-binding protein [Eubacteriales bacterium]
MSCAAKRNSFGNTSTNDGFYRLFEDTRESRLKRTGGAFVNSIHPEDRARLKQAMKSVIDGKDFITLTCRAQKGDGSYMWVRFVSSVEKREPGYLRVYSTYTSMEEEMKSREATQAKTDFLSRMSHDMRTPMNGILGLAALSEDEQDPAVLRDNIRRIRESGDYLLSLINDTLDFQRIESGKLTLDQRVVDAQRVLDAVMDVVRPSMEQKKIRFSVVNTSVDLSWNARLDEMRFKQVLINLLSNAVKFTPEGGEVSFSFGCLGREGMLSHTYLRVSDNGIGMSEEFVRSRLFKPFSQESSAVSTQYVGSGLGLSIVKSLVELMGGRIEVESAPGKGSTFTVYLDFERVPRDEADPLLSSVSRQAEHAERRLAGWRVLLAEDHPLNAEIAKRMLSKAGCEVTWARDGRECLRQFEQSAPGAFDAVLMDVRMPVMDGLSAARAMRALPRADAKAIPIIAITANAYETDVQNCRDAGMNAHLSKPIDVSQLYHTLCDFVEADGAERALPEGTTQNGKGETKHD